MSIAYSIIKSHFIIFYFVTQKNIKKKIRLAIFINGSSQVSEKGGKNEMPKIKQIVLYTVKLYTNSRNTCTILYFCYLLFILLSKSILYKELYGYSSIFTCFLKSLNYMYTTAKDCTLLYYGNSSGSSTLIASSNTEAGNLA
jgi:hypothetical protein